MKKRTKILSAIALLLSMGTPSADVQGVKVEVVDNDGNTIETLRKDPIAVKNSIRRIKRIITKEMINRLLREMWMNDAVARLCTGEGFKFPSEVYRKVGSMEPVTAYYVMYGRPKRGFGTEVAKNNAKRAGFVFFTSPGNKGRHNDCYFEYAYNNTGRCYLVHSDVRLEKPYNVEVSDVKRDTVIKLFATALSDRTKMTIIDLFAGCGGKEGEHKRSTWANHFTVRVFGQGLYGKMYYESGLALVIADKYKELALICSLFAEDGRYWTDKKINAVNDVAVYDSKLKKMLSEYLGIREWEARKLLRSYIGRIDKATIENINNRNDNPIELLRAMWRSYLRIEDGEDIGHRGLRGLREHRLNTMTRILMLGTEKLRESLQESRKIKEWCNLIYRSLVASCELLWYSWMWEQECVENDNWGILFRLRKLAQMYDWLGEGYGKKTFLGSYGIAVGERDYKAKKDRKKKKMEGMHQPLLNLVL